MRKMTGIHCDQVLDEATTLSSHFLCTQWQRLWRRICARPVWGHLFWWSHLVSHLLFAGIGSSLCVTLLTHEVGQRHDDICDSNTNTLSVRTFLFGSILRTVFKKFDSVGSYWIVSKRGVRQIRNIETTFKLTKREVEQCRGLRNLNLQRRAVRMHIECRPWYPQTSVVRSTSVRMNRTVQKIPSTALTRNRLQTGVLWDDSTSFRDDAEWFDVFIGLDTTVNNVEHFLLSLELVSRACDALWPPQSWFIVRYEACECAGWQRQPRSFNTFQDFDSYWKWKLFLRNEVIFKTYALYDRTIFRDEDIWHRLWPCCRSVVSMRFSRNPISQKNAQNTQ